MVSTKSIISSVYAQNFFIFGTYVLWTKCSSLKKFDRKFTARFFAARPQTFVPINLTWARFFEIVPVVNEDF